MKSKKMTRLERCESCACCVGYPTEDDWFCDEYNKPCEKIENCGEWKKDPTV